MSRGADLKRKLYDMTASDTLVRRQATIVSYESVTATATILLGGSVDPYDTIAGVAHLSSYLPVADDVVWVDIKGSDPLIIGKAGASAAQGERHIGEKVYYYWEGSHVINGYDGGAGFAGCRIGADDGGSGALPWDGFEWITAGSQTIPLCNLYGNEEGWFQFHNQECVVNVIMECSGEFDTVPTATPMFANPHLAAYDSNDFGLYMKMDWFQVEPVSYVEEYWEDRFANVGIPSAYLPTNGVDTYFSWTYDMSFTVPNYATTGGPDDDPTNYAPSLGPLSVYNTHTDDIDFTLDYAGIYITVVG